MEFDLGSMRGCHWARKVIAAIEVGVSMACCAEVAMETGGRGNNDVVIASGRAKEGREREKKGDCSPHIM